MVTVAEARGIFKRDERRRGFCYMAWSTNVAWGGRDMRDLYIGTIRRDDLVHARSPIPGMRLVHQRELPAFPQDVRRPSRRSNSFVHR